MIHISCENTARTAIVQNVASQKSHSISIVSPKFLR
jgi:hypothetical protein